jgi:chromate reductase
MVAVDVRTVEVDVYQVGYFVGSLARTSINRTLANALIKVAPPDLRLTEIPIGEVPLYNRDFDDDFPVAAAALKERIASVDALLFVTPEYNRSIPGVLKNAIDWASRPRGENSFARKPSAVIGASPGAIGTALAQQSLRGILSYSNSPQMNAIEAYVQFKPEVFQHDGEVLDQRTAKFLTNYMREFRDFVVRVLTVLPQD